MIVNMNYNRGKSGEREKIPERFIRSGKNLATWLNVVNIRKSL